jgi:type I restriction enzyme R subunit
VKKVAKQLLDTLKQEKLVLDWCRRQQSKAALKVAIEKIQHIPRKRGTLSPVYPARNETLFHRLSRKSS